MGWTRKTMKSICVCFKLFTGNILEVILFSLVVFININHDCIKCTAKSTRLVEFEVCIVS